MSREWLDEFQEHVSGCWAWHSAATQIGFRYAKPEQTGDGWEIWAYPALQEIVGGRNDGERVWTGFNFDVSELLRKFEASAIGLSTNTPTYPSELTFDGKFGGQRVFLHLCHEPLHDALATEIVDFSGGGKGPVVRDKE